MILIEMKFNQAREKLQKAWDEHGVTNAKVLQAGAKFDVLLNEYQQLERNLTAKKTAREL